MRADPFWKFISRCVLPNECWIWCGKVNAGGYGIYSIGGKSKLAHRVAYEKACEPIPDGMVLDHLCRTPGCINPFHLEPVTTQENLRRGEGVCAKKARQTHCKRGHAFDAENTYTHPDRPRHRKCLKCQKEREAKRWDAIRAARG